MDFESLLLQGRVLYRLTNFISRHFGVYTDRFSRLWKQYKILKGMKDRCYSRVSDNSKWFEGTLMKDNLGENLRRFVAHKQSIF